MEAGRLIAALAQNTNYSFEVNLLAGSIDGPIRIAISGIVSCRLAFATAREVGRLKVRDRKLIALGGHYQVRIAADFAALRVRFPLIIFLLRPGRVVDFDVRLKNTRRISCTRR